MFLTNIEIIDVPLSLSLDCVIAVTIIYPGTDKAKEDVTSKSSKIYNFTLFS